MTESRGQRIPPGSRPPVMRPTIPDGRAIPGHCWACNRPDSADVEIVDHGDRIEARWPNGPGPVMCTPEIVERMVELENDRRERERTNPRRRWWRR